MKVRRYVKDAEVSGDDLKSVYIINDMVDTIMRAVNRRLRKDDDK